MNRPRRSSPPKPVSTSLEKKVQDALNESRILVLGVQVLLSFQYTSVLENAFVKLPFISQALELVTLALLLLTFGLLVTPVPYHLLVWRSKDSEDVQTFVSTIVEIALLPFAIGLSIDVYISVQPITGEFIAIVIGGAIFMTAIFFWYVFEAARVRHDENPERAHERGTPMPEHIRATTSTEEKIQHALTEARVVLPGGSGPVGLPVRRGAIGRLRNFASFVAIRSCRESHAGDSEHDLIDDARRISPDRREGRSD